MANMKKRIESESMACVGTCNANMVCVDCLQRYNDSVIPANASRCEAYPDGKPLDIVFGKTTKCPEYVKE